MAEVTEVARTKIFNDAGGYSEVLAQVSVDTTGDTWTPGLRSILGVGCPPFTNLTSVAITTDSPPKIQFTIAGAVTALPVRVWGYK